MDLPSLKRLFLKIMIGSLVAAGGVAVITVLSGQFNEVLARALATIALIAVHALVSFTYIDINQRQKSSNELSIFSNATFIIIILSFITSIFATWSLLGSEITLKLYLTYGVLLFAVLHAEVLSKMAKNSTSISNVVYTNYVFMLLVVLLIMPVIYSSDATTLSDAYYRILAAMGIIDATLTLVAIIMNKLYLQKNPTINPTIFGNVPMSVLPNGTVVAAAPAPQRKKGMNIFLILLICYLGFQLLSGLVFIVMGSQAAKNASKASTTKNTYVATPSPQPSYTPPTPQRNYDYETEFTYATRNYKCTRKIAGYWSHPTIYTNTIKGSIPTQVFTFTPATISDLSNYCVTL
jgi:hypothetical protein